LKVAVIGAGGFVGKRLCDSLKKDETVNFVVSLVRQEFDLTNSDTWGSLDNSVDCVVHAAVLSEGNMYDIYNVNCLNIGSFSTYCNSLGIKKIIYLSTGASNAPNNLQGNYALSKYLAERKISEQYTGHLNILRLYFPYGEGQTEMRLIPKLISRVKNGEVITCNHDGGPSFPVGHIDDLVKVITQDFIVRDNPNKIINVASDQIMSISDMVESISLSLNKEAKMDPSGNQPDLKVESYAAGRWRHFDLTGMLGTLPKQNDENASRSCNEKS